MGDDSLGRVWVVWMAAVVVLSALGGATVTHAYLSDTESASVSITAANDFTVDVGNANIRPADISIKEGNGGTFKVDVTVPDRAAVDTDRFKASLEGISREVSATKGTCELRDGAYDCTVTFSRDDVASLASSGTHTYTFVLHGWWTIDRDFVATDTLTIDTSTNGGGGSAGNTGGSVGNMGAGNMGAGNTGAGNTGAGNSSNGSQPDLRGHTHLPPVSEAQSRFER